MGTLKRGMLAFTVLGALIGCTASMKIGRPDPPLPPNVVSSDKTCRIYLRQPYQPIPELPDIRGKNLTAAELNIVQANYIRELRQWILTSRVKRDEDYNDYVKKCLQ